MNFWNYFKSRRQQQPLHQQQHSKAHLDMERRTTQQQHPEPDLDMERVKHFVTLAASHFWDSIRHTRLLGDNYRGNTMTIDEFVRHRSTLKSWLYNNEVERQTKKLANTLRERGLVQQFAQLPITTGDIQKSVFSKIFADVQHAFLSTYGPMTNPRFQK